MSQPGPSLNPNLTAADPQAAHWIAQASLRLRLELLWLRQVRGHIGKLGRERIPVLGDRVQENLDQLAFWRAKQEFFAGDETARWLLNQLKRDEPAPAAGAFSRVCGELALAPVARFALGLALLPVYDSAVAPVLATAHNDERAEQPTLALLQRLWPKPEEAMALLEPNHALYRHGLLQLDGRQGWSAPLRVAPQVAWLLISGRAEASLLELSALPATPTPAMRACAARARRLGHLRLLPVRAGQGAVREQTLATQAAAMRRPLRRYGGAPGLLADAGYLHGLLTLAWLLDLDLYLDREAVRQVRPLLATGLPEGPEITLYLAVDDELASLPRHLTLPALVDDGSGYVERLALWRAGLGDRAAELEEILPELARRFRYDAAAIDELASSLAYLDEPLTAALAIAACRAHQAPELGQTAQRLQPRFVWDDLVLPAKQRYLFAEIDRAMRNLTRVHYTWGTAQVWNEGGISVLFAGPPGTGKTMAAEVLAQSLDLPLYRIDLSQMVSKYIGETEKNLAAVFDAADIADMILFFDEADALFGRRTDVKDAHDRFANIEVSYLLQRMESFRGLAILATNRKKDLDEAFQRRLRYIVDFPLPGEAEREAIWRKCLPVGVPTDRLDLAFLARQFPLSGGHIRSIVFNACLQSATAPGARLTMAQLVVAVAREYAKLDRELKPSNFGAYAPLLEAAHG